MIYVLKNRHICVGLDAGGLCEMRAAALTAPPHHVAGVANSGNDGRPAITEVMDVIKSLKNRHICIGLDAGGLSEMRAAAPPRCLNRPARRGNDISRPQVRHNWSRRQPTHVVPPCKSNSARSNQLPHTRTTRGSTTPPSTPSPRRFSEFGFRQPIVVDEDGVIIVGHTRYKAALKARPDRGAGPRRQRSDAGAGQGVPHRRQPDGDASPSGTTTCCRSNWPICRSMDFDLDLLGFDRRRAGEAARCRRRRTA